MGVVFCLSDWKLLEPRESLPLSPASSLSHSGVRGGGLGLHIHLQWQTLDSELLEAIASTCLPSGAVHFL